MQRPVLDVERRMESGEWDYDFIVYPHCDARILHLPEECDYCAQCDTLQEERRRLGVSNTGKTNRAWPCPADRARSAENYNAWGGNRAKKLDTCPNCQSKETPVFITADSAGYDLEECKSCLHQRWVYRGGFPK